MLDPTLCGYFSCGAEPMSCLEMRESFCTREGTVVIGSQKYSESLTEKNMANAYLAKNSFFFNVDVASCFVPNDVPSVYVLPEGFDLVKNRRLNSKFMIETAQRENWGDKSLAALKALASLHAKRKTDYKTGSSALWNRPVEKIFK